MEIVLIKPVRKLGSIGNVVKVKNGYGRNFLLPQGLAVRATKQNLELIEKQKADFEKQDKKLKQEKQNIATKIKDKKVAFIRQASDDGRLFGSVTNREIALEISKTLQVEVHRAEIVLASPIKNTGIYSITLDLHPEVNCKVDVIVDKSQDEIQKWLTGENNKVAKNEAEEAESDNNNN